MTMRRDGGYAGRFQTNRGRPSYIRDFQCALLTAVLSTGGITGHAQTPMDDSSTTLAAATEETIKLGARLAIGGQCSAYQIGYLDLANNHFVYGARTELRMPLGSQVDLTAAGEFNYVPARVITETYYGHDLLLGPPSVVEFVTTVPASRLATFSTGIRLYVRTKPQSALIHSLSRRWPRLFWRKRVDRVGLHIGFSGGLMQGWHKRIVRTIPVDWPVNETVPVSAMQQREEGYQRTYWTATPMEFGWTFNGALDITLGLRMSGLLLRYKDWQDDVALVNGEMVAGCLSYVFGRTSFKQP